MFFDFQVAGGLVRVNPNTRRVLFLCLPLAPLPTREDPSPAPEAASPSAPPETVKPSDTRPTSLFEAILGHPPSELRQKPAPRPADTAARPALLPQEGSFPPASEDSPPESPPAVSDAGKRKRKPQRNGIPPRAGEPAVPACCCWQGATLTPFPSRVALSPAFLTLSNKLYRPCSKAFREFGEHEDHRQHQYPAWR